jgi:SsrA-binding protein
MQNAPAPVTLPVFNENIMSIVDNRKAFHDYLIEDKYEAGVMLEGWEVKAIREGRVQLKEAYVIARDNEIFLFGAHVSSLNTVSSFSHPEARRTRKLLLHAAEIKKLVGKVEQAGYTMVPLNLHWVKGRVKCDIALAKGKREYDKRNTEKDRDWQREQQAIMKIHRR